MNDYRVKLLFGDGSLFALVARQVPRKHWLAVVAGVAAAFLYVWVELAAGIFTSLGSRPVLHDAGRGIRLAVQLSGCS